MEIKRCEKGHFYDAEANSTCPQCAAEMEGGSFMETTYGNEFDSYPPTEAAGGSFGNVGPTEAAGGGFEEIPPTAPVYEGAGIGETMPGGGFNGRGAGIGETIPGGGFDGGSNNYGPTDVYANSADNIQNAKSLGGKDMEIKRCEKGHFYDVSVNSTCPQCAAEMGAAKMGGGNKVEMEDTGVTVVFNNKGPVGFSPVVGWLVCTEGPAKGKDYRIRAGYNYIGRDEHMSICIPDQSVSREKHAMIGYDPEERVFFFGPINGQSIVRINGKRVSSTTDINAYDVLTIGKTKLLFVPLCGERFNWDE